MNAYQRALRDLQYYTDDVLKSRYRTFDDALRRFVSVLVPGTPLGDVTARLPDVDFEGWYQAQKATVSSMVGSGRITWPADAEERLAMQVALIKKIASGDVPILEFTTDFMWVGNRLDDNVAEFVQQFFRPFVRDFIRFAHESAEFKAELRASAGAESKEDTVDAPDLFISHSSSDTTAAKAIIALFEKALKLSARRIRCTSVDGYRLPVGADTNEVLRTEVFASRHFVALLTQNSLKSPYALFELGARWGARKPFFPVLACGATADDLKPPLNGLNAISASVPDQVRQLVEESSQVLGKELEPISSFSAEVDAVVAACKATT